MNFAQSSVREFESCLRIVDGLNEDDIQLLSKQCNTIFITYENLGAFTLSKVIQRLFLTGGGGHEGTLQTECDDFIMKTKFLLPAWIELLLR